MLLGTKIMQIGQPRVDSLNPCNNCMGYFSFTLPACRKCDEKCLERIKKEHKQQKIIIMYASI
jgi:hypothetical protein